MENTFGKKAETKCGKCDGTSLSALGPIWPPGPPQSGHPRLRRPSAVPETEVRETDRESPSKGQGPRDICYRSPQKTPRERGRGTRELSAVSQPEPGTAMSPATLCPECQPHVAVGKDCSTRAFF